MGRPSPNDRTGEDTTPTVEVAPESAPELVSEPGPEPVSESEARTAPRGESDRSRLPIAGRYALLEQIGSGGMGAVWRAYDPKLRREVALKQLHHDALGDEAAARLVREAQAMAQLSHPNVVAVYDVELGEDSGAEPANVLIAMEYVAGSDLRKWLEKERAPWPAIVALYRQAARGLAAAHARGLVHRDFKPSNVLIAGDDVRGWTAKVTDFGLAKGVHLRESVGPEPASTSGEFIRGDSFSAQLTEQNTVIGTPRYMSPEQHTGEPAGPATDQYALCIALRESLTGEPPFFGKNLIRAKLRGPTKWPDDSPVPPRIAAAIDRGLAPEPDDRWPSIEALLEHLVVDQGSQRRRVGYGSAVVVLGAAATLWGVREEPCSASEQELGKAWVESAGDETRAAFEATELPYADVAADRVVSDLDAYAAGWIEEHRDACLATTVRGEQSVASLDLRMACLHRARGELSAVGDRVRSADASTVQHAVTLVESLPPLSRCADLAALRQDVPPPDDPEVAAKVAEERERLAVASARRRTGDYTRARQLSEEVAAAARALEYEPLAAEAQLHLASALDDLSELEEAEAALRTSLEIALRRGMTDTAARAATSLLTLTGHTRSRHDEAKWLVPVALSLSKSADPNGTLEARVHHAIAMLHDSKGEYEESAKELLIARDLHVRVGGERSVAVANEDQHLGLNAASRGKYEESEALLRRGMEVNAKLRGDDHPSVANALTVLSNTLRWLGRNDEAMEAIQRALAIRRRVLPADHPLIGDTLSNLGIVHYVSGDYEAAVADNLEALRLRRKNGEVTDDVADSYNNLGACYSALGRYDEAQLQHENALKIRQVLFDEDHPAIGMSLTNLAIAARNQARYDEAADFAKRAVDISVARLGPDHADVANQHETYGNVLQDLEDFEGALAQYDRAIQIRKSSLGDGHAEVARSLLNRSNVYEKQERFEEAEAGFRRAIEIWEREVGPEYTDLAHGYVGLGSVLSRVGHKADAIAAYERALEIRTPGLGEDHPRTVELREALEELRRQ